MDWRQLFRRGSPSSSPATPVGETGLVPVATPAGPLEPASADRAAAPPQPIVRAAEQNLLEYVADYLMNPEIVVRDDYYGNLTRARRAETTPSIRGFLIHVTNHLVGTKGFRARPANRFRNGPAQDIARDFNGWLYDLDLTGHAKGTQYFRELIWALARDGELFLRLLPLGQGVEWLDPLEIPHRNTAASRRERQGIAYDDYLRPVAYYRKYRNADRREITQTLPADEVIHVYYRTAKTQLRGVPWGIYALNALQLLEQFERALLKNSLQSVKTGLVIQPDRHEDFTAAAVRTIAAEDGTVQSPQMDGDVTYAPAGTRIENLANNFPHSLMEPLKSAVVDRIALSLGVNSYTVSNDISKANFVSFKFGASNERLNDAAIQDMLVQSMLKPLFRYYLGRVQLLPPERIAMYERQMDWPVQKPESLDGARDAQQHASEINAGTRSRREVIELRGGDADEVFAQLEQEAAMAMFNKAAAPRTAGPPEFGPNAA